MWALLAGLLATLGASPVAGAPPAAPPAAEKSGVRLRTFMDSDLFYKLCTTPKGDPDAAANAGACKTCIGGVMDAFEAIKALPSSGMSQTCIPEVDLSPLRDAVIARMTREPEIRRTMPAPYIIFLVVKDIPCNPRPPG